MIIVPGLVMKVDSKILQKILFSAEISTGLAPMTP